MDNYNCFSIKQMQFLINNKLSPIHVGQHSQTKRMYWVFKMNEELSTLLSKWTNNKVAI